MNRFHGFKNVRIVCVLFALVGALYGVGALGYHYGVGAAIAGTALLYLSLALLMDWCAK